MLKGKQLNVIEPLMYIDPIKRKVQKVRRRAFNPYSFKKWIIYTEVHLKTIDFENLSVDDITLNFRTNDSFCYKDQIESWRQTYGIDERYKAKILGERGAKKWFGEFDELENLKKLKPEQNATIEKLYEMKIKEIDSDPLDNGNFIKKAFLEECKNKGLVNIPAFSI